MQGHVDALPAETAAEIEVAVEHYSLLAATVKRLIRNRVAMAGLVLVVALILIAVAAPFITARACGRSTWPRRYGQALTSTTIATPSWPAPVQRTSARHRCWSPWSARTGAAR